MGRGISAFAILIICKLLALLYEGPQVASLAYFRLPWLFREKLKS